MINATEAKECGLNIAVIDIHSQMWKLAWEIYIRSDFSVSATCNKVIETASIGLQG
jgi:hypothetical protein